ncbi:MAG: hypothetical protein VX589_01850 [Myxococcota bacterium]|nr:hypothetical protein [Myxococcota bacterium]
MNTHHEFRVFGLTMTALTVGYGLLLVLWGAVFSIGSKSFTSLIPAMIGVPILLSGVLAAVAPAKRKVWMHIAVVFGVLAFVGGFRFFSGLSAEGGLFAKPKAASSQLMLLITGGVYTMCCVRSFISARRNPGQQLDA